MQKAKQSILLTGATGGLGRALSRSLVESDSIVIGCGRRREKLQSLRENLPHNDEMFIPCSFHLENYADLQKQVGAVLAQHSIDVLINNAAVLLDAPNLTETTPENAESTLRINVLAPFYLTQLILPQMLKRNKGIIINISSTAGLSGHPAATLYSASKSALNAISQATAKAIEGTNIRCVTVSPGPINTTMRQAFAGDASTHQSPDAVASILQSIISGDREAANGAHFIIKNGNVSLLPM